MAETTAPVSDPQAEALAQELFEVKRFAAQLAIERQHLSDSVDSLRVRERDAAHAELTPHFEAARRERDHARAERDAALAERDAAWAERDRARAEAHDAKAMLDRVTSSTAWRVTGPARRLLQALLGR